MKYSESELTAELTKKLKEEEESKSGKGGSVHKAKRTSARMDDGKKAKDIPKQDESDEGGEGTPQDIENIYKSEDKEKFVQALSVAQKNNEEKFTFNGKVYPTQGAQNVVNQLSKGAGQVAEVDAKPAPKQPENAVAGQVAEADIAKAPVRR